MAPLQSSMGMSLSNSMNMKHMQQNMKFTRRNSQCPVHSAASSARQPAASSSSRPSSHYHKPQSQVT